MKLFGRSSCSNGRLGGPERAAARRWLDKTLLCAVAGAVRATLAAGRSLWLRRYSLSLSRNRPFLAEFDVSGCTNQSIRASAFHTLVYRMPPSNRRTRCHQCCVRFLYLRFAVLFITTMLHLDQILLSKERTPSIRDLQNLVAKSPRASLPSIQTSVSTTPQSFL